MASQGSQSETQSVTYIPDRNRQRPVKNRPRSRREVTLRSITFTKDWSEQVSTHLQKTQELGEESSIFKFVSGKKWQSQITEDTSCYPDKKLTLKDNVSEMTVEETVAEQDELEVVRQESEDQNSAQREERGEVLNDVCEDNPALSLKNVKTMTTSERKRTKSHTFHLSLNDGIDNNKQQTSVASKSTRQELGMVQESNVSDINRQSTSPSRTGRRSISLENAEESEAHSSVHSISVHESRTDTQPHDVSGDEVNHDVKRTPQYGMKREDSQNPLQTSSNISKTKNIGLQRKRKSSSTAVLKTPPSPPSKLSKRRSLYQRSNNVTSNSRIESHFFDSSQNSSPILGSELIVSNPPATKRIKLSGHRKEHEHTISPQRTPAMLDTNKTLGTSQIGLPQVTSTPRVHGKMTQHPRHSDVQKKLLASGPAIRRTKSRQPSVELNHVKHRHQHEATPARTSNFEQQKKAVIHVPNKKLSGRKLLVNDEGGTTHGSQVTDLDVILESMYKSTAAFRNRLETKICKKATTDLLELMATGVTDTVIKIHRMKKKFNMFNRNKLMMKKKRTQLSELRKEHSTLLAKLQNNRNYESERGKTGTESLGYIHKIQQLCQDCHAVSKHRTEKTDEILHCGINHEKLPTTEKTQVINSVNNIVDWLQCNNPLYK